MRSLLCGLLTASLLTSFAAQARSPASSGEFSLLNERLSLVRGKPMDAFTREFTAPADGTCAVIIEEDDGDAILTVESTAPASKVEVESGLYGEGIEVATIPVTRGAKFSISITSQPDMLNPVQAPTRVTCYDAASKVPASQARAAAYRAWSEATSTGGPTTDEEMKRRRTLMDVAIDRLQQSGDARMVAWAWLMRGSILNYAPDDIRNALADLHRGEKAFTELRDPEPRNVARSHFLIGAMLTEMLTDTTWTNPTPEEARVESRRLFTELAADSAPTSAVEKSRSVKYLGLICFRLAEYDCATRYFEAAADASRKIGQRTDEISALNNLAATAGDLGNYTTAVRYFDRVMPLVNAGYFEKYAPVRYTNFNYNAAVAYSNVGDTSRAIRHLLLAQANTQSRHADTELGRVLFGLGSTYWLRGDIEQAGTYFTESLRLRRQGSDSPGLLQTLLMVGRFERLQGHLDQAMTLHREALERAAIPDLKARARHELALDQAAAGHLEEAIGSCRAALAEPGGETTRRAYTKLLLAKTLIALKPDAANLAEADQLSRAGLAQALAQSDTFLEVDARHVRARYRLASGDAVAARREYESTIAIILDFRGTIASPELRATTLAQEQETFREYTDLLMRGAVARGTQRFAPASRDEQDALRVLELARSSATAPVQDAGLDPEKQARIDELLQQMAQKRVRLAVLNDAATASSKTAQTLQLEMSKLRAEVDQLRGGSVGDARSTRLPKRINRPWPPVAAGVTQLSYALGGHHAYLWARDASGLRVAVLAAPPAQIERQLADFAATNAVRTPARLEELLAQLSATLLPAGTVTTTTGSLEIVADGTLGTLPFAALRLPDSRKRVVETHAVRMISAIFDTAAPPPDKPRALVLVGVSSNTGEMRSAGHEFSSLGAARAEAREIARLFAQQVDATQIRLLTAADGDEQTLRTLWSGGSDVVHFATHGLANLRYPSGSLLLLPKSEADSATYLTAGEVQEWRGDAGLVFLAACETAAGPARFAEGMSGLPRSFLTAGARGVVGTLWPVEDLYESQFSVEFYRRFIVSRDAELALAATQRAWLSPRAGEKEREHQQRLATAWAHVFYARPESR